MIMMLIAAGLFCCFAALARVLTAQTQEERLTALYVIGAVAAVIAVLYSIHSGTLLPLLVAVSWLVQVYMIVLIIRRMEE